MGGWVYKHLHLMGFDEFGQLKPQSCGYDHKFACFDVKSFKNAQFCAHLFAFLMMQLANKVDNNQFSAICACEIELKL